MAPRIALKNEPQPTPERQALGEAAQRWHDLAKQDAALGEALMGVETDLMNARRDLAAAEQRLEAAELAAVEARVAEALGGDAVPPGSTLAEARQAIPPIKDRINELDGAKTRLLVNTGPLAQRQIWAATALDEAVRQVLRTSPEAAALVGRLDIVRAEHVTLQKAVDYLALLGALPERVRLEEIKQNGEVEARWRAAVACLRTDCSALLPWSNPEPLKKDFDDDSNKN